MNAAKPSPNPDPGPAVTTAMGDTLVIEYAEPPRWARIVCNTIGALIGVAGGVLAVALLRGFLDLYERTDASNHPELDFTFTGLGFLIFGLWCGSGLIVFQSIDRAYRAYRSRPATSDEAASIAPPPPLWESR